MKKKKLTGKKELIYLIIVIALIIAIIWFCTKDPKVIISRGGATSDYYKYGEYEALIKFIDSYDNISPILGIISLILGIILFVIACIRAKLIEGATSAKGLFIIRWMFTSIVIIIIPIIFPFMVLSFNGVKVMHCWCGLDYVKVEYKK